MNTPAIRLSGVLALALLSTSALAADTGSYCNTQTDKIVSYYCNGTGRPGPNWNGPDGNGCYAAEVRGTCSALADTAPVFDEHQYGVLNSDVAQSGMSRLQHWRQYGKAEGRPSSFGFVVREYVDENGDVKNAYGTNWPAAIDQYTKYGLFEKRPARARSTWFTPSWPVSILNRPVNSYSLPNDGSYQLVIFRSGEGSLNNGDYSTNTPIQTGYDTSWFTGMTSPRSNGQFFGPLGQDLIDGARGFTGAQRFGEQFALAADTRSNTANLNAYAKVRGDANGYAEPSSPVLGRNPPGGQWLPWSNGGQGLRTAFELRMPQAGGSAPAGRVGGATMSAYYFVDKIRQNPNDPNDPAQSFYIGAAMYDTRPGFLTPNFIPSLDTINANSPILNVALRKGSPYITVQPYSAEATDGPNQEYKGVRIYDFDFTASNLVEIIREAKRQLPDNVNIKNLPEDAARYRVVNFNLNPEAFYQLDGNKNKISDGWIGVSGRMLASGPK